MEGSNPEQANPTNGRTTGAGTRRRFVAYTIAALAATLGTVVLVFVILAHDSSATDAAGQANAQQQATGVIFFDEYHVTLLVSPGSTGENTVDLILAHHDGTSVEGVSDVTVSAIQPLDGTELSEFPAEPVAGSPGTFTASGLSIPSAGDWEFGVSLRAGAADPVSNTTLISIGAPSSAD